MNINKSQDDELLEILTTSVRSSLWMWIRRPMIRRVFALSFVLFLARSTWSQIPAIDDTFSAKDRLSKYLINADSSQDMIAVFYREQTASTNESNPDLLVAHRNSGIFIQSTKERLRYISADFDSLGRGNSNIPFRYESFIVNGKEKRRFYDCTRSKNNKTAKDVPLDPETGQRTKVNIGSPDFFGVHGKEIEPFGLAIGDRISAQSRFSSIDRLIKMLLSDFSLEPELESKPGTLTGKWRRGTYVREITFDDSQGGMPCLTRNYVLDSKGKPTSDYNSVLRSTWKEVPTDLWVIEKLSISFSDKGRSAEHQFEFVWCDAERLKEFFERGEFKTKHQNDDTDWNGPAYRLFFPEPSNAVKNDK